MSKIEVNAIEPQCGTNLTVGASGDTITFPSGTTVVNNGSQTGFGRTGTVDWNTTAITADPANAVSGTGYFANTTSAAFTITLPTSPSAGDIVAVRDYAQTFATNNLTIGRNSQPIDGQTFDLILDTNGQAVTLIYVDGTQGWKSVNSNETINQALYVTATGGTITTSGDFKIHTFTGPGTFTVCSVGNPAGSTTVDYLVVAGGGGGGGSHGGGGGAGGFRESCGGASGCYTTSPLAKSCGALPVSAQAYPITVGGGGTTGFPNPAGGAKATSGANSVFSTITAAGGGGGGTGCNGPQIDGRDGGSGGGGSSNGSTRGCKGAGNIPSVTPAQGTNGGDGTTDNATYRDGGGGGGATVGGTSHPNPSSPPSGNPGGAGTSTSITGSSVTYAGGGGGGGSFNSGSGSSGGGGTGGTNGSGTAQSGTANKGGGAGGGGGAADDRGGSGGSGIVVIRYKFQ